MIVDAHAHWYSDECLAALAHHCPELDLIHAPDGTRVVRLRGSIASLIPPFSFDLADRLGLMDELGIRTQVLSCGALDVGWAGEHAAAVAELRAKYRQYEDHRLETRPVIRIAIDRVVTWGDLSRV